MSRLQKNAKKKKILHTNVHKTSQISTQGFALHFVQSVLKPKSVVSLSLRRCVSQIKCICILKLSVFQKSGISGVRMYQGRARRYRGQNDLQRRMILFVCLFVFFLLPVRLSVFDCYFCVFMKFWASSKFGLCGSKTTLTTDARALFALCSRFCLHSCSL